MNEPKTPNLGLNKIDRSSPSMTYFDLDKYLDQNWEKVDEGVGQVGEKAEETAAQVSSIQERLDTEKRRSVTLEPGLQIFNAKRASALKLEGLKGRTLVNLLGRRGNGESLSGLPVATNSATIALDSMTKELGTSSFKITATGSESTEHYVDLAVLDVLVGACYVLIAKAKPDAKANGRLMAYGIVDESPSDFFPESNLAGASDRYNTLFLRFNPVTAKKVMVRLQVPNSSGDALYVPDGQMVNYDSIRLYRITPGEYHALSNMTPEQINAKYPYVDSVQPVRNPYAIRYGENLLPTFMDWKNIAGTTKVINSPYNLEINNPNNGDDVQYYFNCSKGDVFTLSVDHTGRIGVNAWDINGNTIGTSSVVPYTSSQSTTFTMPAETVRASIHFGNIESDGKYLATCSFKNPMLTFGTSAKPFKPRKDVMLALQTNLYADPLTGANADEVFEKDGQYFKVKKWQKVDFEGSRITSTILGNKSGFKTLYPKLEGANYGYSSISASAAVKYDGKILTWGSHEAIADGWAIDKLNNNFAISVSNADSGWGDAYTPTVNEIKAYFMGWTMRNMSASTYNDPTNASQKTWTPIGYSPPANWNSTWAHLRTSVPVNESSPSIKDGTISSYQLVYQLVTPTVERITSEGQLTLFEGNNQVEVGTGLVVRELANPIKFTNYDINTGKTMGNATVYAVRKWIALYKNGRIEPTGWGVFEGHDNGKALAIYSHGFDPSATYTVTYLMLGTSPATSFVGLVTENEKALLTDLNEVVQQNAARVSVTEKALYDAIKILMQQYKRNVWGSI
ncbi:MAG: hypothetical protein ACE3K2_04785 [Paenibacillus sp.]|uniref:hypothetical protein n=1 Tax=Paenibacillus sp. TaxID=58172 RepID=UPI003B77B360